MVLLCFGIPQFLLVATPQGVLSRGCKDPKLGYEEIAPCKPRHSGEGIRLRMFADLPRLFPARLGCVFGDFSEPTDCVETDTRPRY